MLTGVPERPLDAEIDHLYQLPLDEFTAARNALAKTAGKDGETIRRLQKPPVPAWAINQVYWKARPTYHAFSTASAALKSAHAAVLGGKRADLRAAGKAHEEAFEAMLKAALAILDQTGQPATDATKQTIATTLRALPASPDPPGRLSRTLQPGGFELLAGMPIAPGGARPADAPRERPTAPAPVSKGKDAARAKAIAKAKDALAAAQRTEKAASQAMGREEFESARATREAERATERLEAARKALEDAQEALDAAETEAETTSRKRDAAIRKVREAGQALESARMRTEAAQAELARNEDK